jgi:hypothetical protein
MQSTILTDFVDHADTRCYAATATTATGCRRLRLRYLCLANSQVAVQTVCASPPMETDDSPVRPSAGRSVRIPWIFTDTLLSSALWVLIEGAEYDIVLTQGHERSP